MDLALVMSLLRPNENVSPDLSSYDVMVAHWRGSTPAPSLQEVTDKWNEIETDLLKKQVQKAYEQDIYAKLVSVGITQDEMFKAMWQKFMNNEPAQADSIKIVIDQITAETLPPVL